MNSSGCILYMSLIAKAVRHLAVLMWVIVVCSCELTSRLSPHNYDYPATLLLDISHAHATSDGIDSPFGITFQGVIYNRFYVSSDSYIAFG